MITETGYSCKRLEEVVYERHTHHRRRHRTLDRATLDQFNFVCIPLRPSEVNDFHRRIYRYSSFLQTSLSQSNLIGTALSLDPSSIVSPTRRVRFKFDEDDKNCHQTRSSDDLRSIESNSIHRVEFQIPIRQGSIVILRVLSFLKSIVFLSD